MSDIEPGIESESIPKSVESAQPFELKYKPFSFQEWLKVLPHTHTKLSTLSFDSPDARQTLQNWQDGAFSTKILLELAGKLGEKKGGFFVVDSDHAAHSLDAYHPDLFKGELDEANVRLLRKQAFSKEQLPSTIKTLSANFDLRRQAIERLKTQNPDFKDRIFTGVEVDILNRDGVLDIDNSVLSKLDVVGASYHRGEWADTNGIEASLDDILNAYGQLAVNPNIDVINHFIRELGEKVQQEIQSNPSCFDSLFETLAKNNKCLEINLRDLVDPNKRDQNKLVLELLQRAKQKGVKFILGTDFHRLEQYLPEELPDDSLQTPISQEETSKLTEFAKADTFFKSKEEAAQFDEQLKNILEKDVFVKGKGAFGLPSNLTKLARPIFKAIRQLESAGVASSDIINGNIDNFRSWVGERRGVKDRILNESEGLPHV